MGFSLADPVHGPAIVLNRRGENDNPWVRRFTVAHELCHVLHDERNHRASVQVQEEEGDPGVGPEPRANGFAACLFAPDAAVRTRVQMASVRRLALARKVRRLMERFGLNFKTARYRLIHAWRVPREEVYALTGVPTRPDPCRGWHDAEALREDELLPCPSVPDERRGMLPGLVAEAWRQGGLDRRQAVELLQAAPDEPIELLADRFAPEA